MVGIVGGAVDIDKQHFEQRAVRGAVAGLGLGEQTGQKFVVLAVRAAVGQRQPVSAGQRRLAGRVQHENAGVVLAAAFAGRSQREITADPVVAPDIEMLGVEPTQFLQQRVHLGVGAVGRGQAVAAAGRQGLQFTDALRPGIGAVGSL